MLGDFDEGKRSCRFKLERHNNRRRRKVQESGEDAATPAGENEYASHINGVSHIFRVPLLFFVIISSIILHLGSVWLRSCAISV